MRLPLLRRAPGWPRGWVRGRRALRGVGSARWVNAVLKWHSVECQYRAGSVVNKRSGDDTYILTWTRSALGSVTVIPANCFRIRPSQDVRDSDHWNYSLPSAKQSVWKFGAALAALEYPPNTCFVNYFPNTIQNIMFKQISLRRLLVTHIRRRRRFCRLHSSSSLSFIVSSCLSLSRCLLSYWRRHGALASSAALPN